MANAERLIELFNEAKARPPGPERERFLAEACPGDPELQAQVISLLQAYEGAGDFLNNTTPTVVQVTEKPGDKIGRYKLLQQVGEGGCGVVYMAEQSEPVRRRVALKVIKLGMDTKQVVARFEAERQALALMDHPNIAKVFDAGATDTGRPYFVMELVRGIKITDYCDQNKLSTTERLDLFIQVCQAIQHAHQKGIIHRDIKPSNILVAQHDTQAVPKVIDFGIAKATTDQRLTDKTLFTAFEQFMGTPAYMSPEQAQMSGLDIDTRTDIYSLGVLLYELLTGQPPFDPEELMRSGLDAMRRTIREKEPVRPSKVVESLSELRVERPEAPAKRGWTTLNSQLKPLSTDLDWIVMKCLEKDRMRRYETANGLAADLKRHLNNEPVVARPASRFYEFQKTVRRHKFGFAATAAVLLALASGAVVSTWQAVHATRQQRTAETQRLRAETAERQTREQLWTSSVAQARSGRLSGRPGRRFDSLDAVARATAIRPSIELRNEAIACLALTDLRVQTKWSQPGLTFFDADLQHYALGDEQGSVSIREVATHREVSSLPGLGVGLGADRDEKYHALLFSPDNEFLAVRNRTGEVQVWNWRQRELIFPTASQLAARATGAKSTNDLSFGRNARMQFTPDSRSLAVVQADGALRVFALGTGEEQRRFVLEKPPFSFLRFSPAGDKFCLVRPDGQVQLHHASDGRLLKSFSGGSGGYAAWHPDGRRLATGGYDNKVHLWDTETGEELASFSGHQSVVTYVAFSHDGNLLASSSWDTTTRLWDADSGKELLNLRTGGHWPQFSRDDRRFVRSNPVADLPEVHEVALGDEFRTLVMPEESNWAYALHFSPDGRLLASGHANVIALWDSASARQLATFPSGYYGDVRFSADGRTLFASGPAGLERRAIHLQAGPAFDTIHLGPPETIGGRVTSTTTSVTDDGRTMVVSDSAGARVLNLDDPMHEVLLRTRQNIAISAAISPKGDWIAIGALGALEIWDARSNVFQRAFPVPVKQFVVFSPDGQWLVSGSGREYQIREVGTWNLRQRLARNPSSDLIRPMAFSRDGRMLAIGITHDTVQLLDTATWRELATLESPQPTMLVSLSFSPDGTQLAVGSTPRLSALWNLRLIRRQLAAMNLDWELPPYPPENRLRQSKPLRVTVEPGPPRTN